jgi:methylglyoxal synthase
MLLKRNIALVAHDNKKEALVEWCDFNKGTLALHNSYATGGTGKKIIEKTNLNISLLKDGSRVGDMEIGALIANEKLDYLIFFWDPLESLPHDVDVKALLSVAVLYNVPTACNRTTADLIIKSTVPERGVQSEEEYIHKLIAIFLTRLTPRSSELAPYRETKNNTVKFSGIKKPEKTKRTANKNFISSIRGFAQSSTQKCQTLFF